LLHKNLSVHGVVEKHAVLVSLSYAPLAKIRRRRL